MTVTEFNLNTVSTSPCHPAGHFTVMSRSGISWGQTGVDFLDGSCGVPAFTSETGMTAIAIKPPSARRIAIIGSLDDVKISEVIRHVGIAVRLMFWLRLNKDLSSAHF